MFPHLHEPPPLQQSLSFIFFMAQRSRSPAYFADTEGSDSEQFDMDPPYWRNKRDRKSGRDRRVSIRTPSEEDLYESGHTLDQARRPPTPYAITRHSSQSEVKKRTNISKCDKALPVTDPSPAAAPRGTQTYNNPAGSSAPTGINHIFVHHSTTTPNGLSSNAPQYQTVQFPGQQQAPVFKMAEQLGHYQNAGPPNNGVHFQPQTPDTSLGPMYHHYIPRSDGQAGAYMVAPGMVAPGIVCHHLDTLVTPAPLIMSSPIAYLHSHPISHGQQAPFAIPNVTSYPAVIASAPAIYTTLGYMTSEGCVTPREVVVR